VAPQTAIKDIDMLSAMRFPTSDEPYVMRRSTSLALESKHHLFDTLYNAVALEHADTLLVTADDRYRKKAERFEMTAALHDWGSAM
jgi:predicted nucleic acid-binding protein